MKQYGAKKEISKKGCQFPVPIVLPFSLCFRGQKGGLGSPHITLLTFSIRFLDEAGTTKTKQKCSQTFWFYAAPSNLFFNIVQNVDMGVFHCHTVNIWYWAFCSHKRLSICCSWLFVILLLKMELLIVVLFVKVMISLIKQACLQTSVLTHQNFWPFCLFSASIWAGGIIEYTKFGEGKLWQSLIYNIQRRKSKTIFGKIETSLRYQKAKWKKRLRDTKKHIPWNTTTNSHSPHPVLHRLGSRSLRWSSTPFLLLVSFVKQ